MPGIKTTLNLLEVALALHNGATWCREMGVSVSALSQGKKRGRLSPMMAGYLALRLGLNAEHWISVATFEAEKQTPLLLTVKKNRMPKTKRKTK